uniref:Uncharacterized protein n=1 Tax=Plectus sambesii TaxID=2011161 RepID=A0A914VUI5_9BILA
MTTPRISLFILLVSFVILSHQQEFRHQGGQTQTDYDAHPRETVPRQPAPRAKPIYIPGLNIPRPNIANTQQNHEYQEGEYVEYIHDGSTDTDLYKETLGTSSGEIESFDA